MCAGYRLCWMLPLVAAYCAVPAEAAECKPAGAIYRPVSPDMTGKDSARYEAELRFRNSGIANEAPFMLVMRQAGTGRAHHFSFAQPNGYGQSLISRLSDSPKNGDKPDENEAEEPSASALFFDARLRTIDPLFDRPAKSAPAYMLFADLGKAFWYSTLPDARSFVPPRSLWKRVACGR